MKKPAHQWETRLHRAERAPARPHGFDDDPRAESFTLNFHDGRVGRAALGLERQEVDALGASDPDLVHAVTCWLAARGARSLNLWCDENELSRGPFTIQELSAPSPSSARLITLCPSNAEMVHALGVFDRVIACEDSSDYPAEVREKERLGPDLGPNLDRVAELAPDLVVASLTVPGMERVVTGLRARGIAHVVLAPRSLDDVLDDVDFLARALGVEARGRALRTDLERQREELLNALPARKARVYLEWWPKPMFTPGATCYSNELIALAGGENVFRARPGASVQVSTEELVETGAEICFVSWCGVHVDKLDPDNVLSRPGLTSLPAVQSRHVYVLDEAYSGRPGPRMLEASRTMARAIRRMIAGNSVSLESDS